METRVKVVFMKAGEEYSATKAYRLHDYVVIDGVTVYACKKVDAATMTCVGHPLTDTEYWDKFLDMEELKASLESAADAAVKKAETATTNANAATKSATDAASVANTAKANADKATTAANTAASAANTAKTNADTATGKANAAAAGAEKVNATITADNVLKVTDRNGAEKTLELIGQAEAATIKTELAGKFDKANVVQELGEAKDKVVSQKVLSTELSDLTTNINNVRSITDFNLAVSCGFFRTNLCNQNDPDFKDGYFVTLRGTLQKNELTAASGFIPFSKVMKSLICSVNGKPNVWGNVYTALYDINKKFISAIPGNKNVIWQEGVAFARFSFVHQKKTKQYQVEVGTEPTSYIEYGRAVIKDVVKVPVKSIEDGSVILRKKIQINTSDSEIEILLKMKKAFDEGYYDVYWEHGTYTFSEVYLYMEKTLGWSWTLGLPIGNNCRYYFNDSTLISNKAPEGYTGNSRNILDCKASSQNFELYDGILINNGGTYCVHDEADSAEDFYRHVYKNMRMTYNVTTDSGSLYMCIGGGSGKRGLIIIENCVFDISNNVLEVTWHKANGDKPFNMSFSISNCHFKNRFEFNNTSVGSTVSLNLNNSSMKSFPSFKFTTLVQFNNEIRGGK